MQDCNGLTNAFVETDMADMEGLRKQIAINHAMAIVMKCVAAILLIQCTLYPNAHATYLKILIQFGCSCSINDFAKHCNSTSP